MSQRGMSMETLNVLSDVIEESFEDRAFGTIIGSCAGDACGLYFFN